MFIKRLIYVLLCGFLICSCRFENLFDDKNVTVGTWNVQTFFDGVTCGTEYSEFKKGDSWNQEKYEVRLDRLCDVISQLDCDILVMEELENEGVIYDINNRLAGNSWDQKKCWNYSCFAKNAGDSIGCGIISRYELVDLKVHNLDVRTELTDQPSMRPIIEVTAIIGKEEVKFFVNHWKSKSGGEKETEVWRNFQERMLSSRLKENLCFKTVICGDFNRDILEFKRGESNLVFMRGFGIENEDGVSVESVWLDMNGNVISGNGSYYFDSQWERIDHFFVRNGIKVVNFEPFAKTPWCTEDGIPCGYKIYTGSGYSDHVPLKMEISF